MARRFFQLVAGAALIQLGILTAPSKAEAPATQPSPASAASSSSPEENPKVKRERPQFRRENLTPEQQKYYDNLPPDQQQSVRENWQRWQKMTLEERERFRENEKVRHEKMLAEIEAAIKASGLQLDDKGRDEYMKRYTEERRKIEQKLQKEMEEKRRPLVQALIERLKEEFSDKSSPAAASPSPSPGCDCLAIHVSAKHLPAHSALANAGKFGRITGDENHFPRPAADPAAGCHSQGACGGQWPPLRAGNLSRLPERKSRSAVPRSIAP